MKTVPQPVVPSSRMVTPFGRHGPAPSSFLTVLGKERKAALIALAETVTFQRDEKMALEGQQTTDMLIVSKGLIKLLKRRASGQDQIVALCFPGDLINLTQRQERWPFTAQAAVLSAIYRVHKTKFSDFVHSDRAVEEALCDFTGERLIDCFVHNIVLAHHNADERIAGFFMDMMRRAPSRTEHGLLISLPIRRVEIANYLGLKLETVSRAITRLRADGIMETPKLGQVLVLKPQALTDRAQLVAP